jgi:hypothetical protein
MQVDFIQATGEGISGHGWFMRARLLTDLSFPVPTLQPQTMGVPVALDLQPRGPNPIESGGNGWSWVDCCNADVMFNNDTPVTCGRLGIKTINGAPAGYVGTVTYNGAPAGNFWIETGTQLRWGVAYNGNFLPYTDNAYSLGVPANRATAVYATNGTIQTSDEREKADIKATKLGLDFIKSIVPVSYRWKDGEEHHQGVIAQNVQAAANGEACGVSGDDRLSLNYSELIGPLIKAVQELSEKVEQKRG